MARLDRSRPARMALASLGLVGAGILGRDFGGDPMQARRGYRIGANPTTQGVGERDDGPHSNKPTRRNAW